MKKNLITSIILVIFIALSVSSCSKQENNIKVFDKEITVTVNNSANLTSYGITAYLEEVFSNYYEFTITIHNNNTYCHYNVLCSGQIKECLEQAKYEIQDLYMLENGWHEGCITENSSYIEYLGEYNYTNECLYIRSDKVRITYDMLEQLCNKIDYILKTYM